MKERETKKERDRWKRKGVKRTRKEESSRT